MKLKNYRILVTGAAGFIGSHTIDRLIAEGRQVWVLDNLSTGSLANLTPHIKDGSLKFVQGDIGGRSLLKELMGKVDAVVHLAALLDHEMCLRDPQLADHVNHQGTITLLEEARKHDLSRFVYASSAAIYGDPARVPTDEECEPAPLNPYGASKLAGERACVEHWRTHGLRTICLRYFNVFGPDNPRVNIAAPSAVHEETETSGAAYHFR